MRKEFKLIVILFFAVFMSCEDILEKDITNDDVTLISPPPKMNIKANSVDFYWKELEGADKYRLQVSNDTTNEIVVDSTITTNKVSLPIFSGDYNWRVKGENFAYSTAYSFPRKFSIENTNDLTNQTVFLLSPSNNFYTNENTIILTWESVNFATTYSLQIDKLIDNTITTVLSKNDVNATNFNLDATILNEDAEYVWKVKAANDNSQSKFFERKILLDTNTPSSPGLDSPSDNQNTTKTVSFSWSLQNDTGKIQSPVKFELQLASKDDFSALIKTYDTSEKTQQHTFDSAGEFFWRVRARDIAGNISSYSQVRSLTVE